MKILLCSSTYEGITHGPAKFANLMMQINELYPEHEVRTITRDIKSEVPNRIYKFERSYPPIIGAFWEYWDNQHFLNQIKRVSESYLPEAIVFVDAVLGYKTAKHFQGKIKTIGLINDDEYINNEIKAIKLTKEWLIKWKSRQLEKRAAKELDLVVGNSDFITEKISTAYNIARPQVVRLYKSIDISNFEYVEHDKIEKSKPVKVLFVKNDYTRGGLSELAEALARLEQINFAVYVAGPHDHQKQRIDGYFANKQNLNYNFLGKISQKEVIRLMDECDMFSVPALREGLGVANIEALAKGIPVVSTNAGGIPEVLDGDNCGWIAKAGNIDSLADAFSNCIDAHELRVEKSSKGRARVEAMFGHETMLENFLKIIAEA